jgi:hypothetical protein
VIILGRPGIGRAWRVLGHPVARVSVETIQILGMESQRGEFWPRLRRLECNIGWDFVPFISSFLTPTITTLDITLPSESNLLLQPTLSLLTRTCRQLQSLAMEVDASDPLSVGEMVHLISASRYTLRRIEIRSFTPPDIFPVIFSLPGLQDLTLHEPRLPNQIPPKILPCLQAINFSGNHGPTLTRFFGRLSVQRLAEVRISCGGIIQFPKLLDTLRGATTIINVLDLSPVTVLDHSTITLLSMFTNLTFLAIGCICNNPKLKGKCSFRPTDEDVLELGNALPYIRTLSLSPSCRAPYHTTFKSLVHLSRTCGNLESLSLRVDFASLGDPNQLNHGNADRGDTGARLQRATSRLGGLTLGNSPLPGIPRCEWVIAMALASIFPSITFLSSSCTGGMQNRWGEVWRDILVCQRVFRIARVGKCLTTHGLVVPTLTRSLQTPLQFREPLEESYRPQVALIASMSVGCGTRGGLWDDPFVGAPFKGLVIYLAVRSVWRCNSN